MLEVLAEAAQGAGEHDYPTAFGIAPHGWVAIAMLVVFAIALRAGVPKIIAKILDDRIATIRKQLEDAARLRTEAEALRDEYAGKIAGAEKEAAELVENARAETKAILEKAEADSKALVERRKQMAEDKIAAAERDAIEDVRNRAVTAAASASRTLIADKHDADADGKLADEVISGI